MKRLRMAIVALAVLVGVVFFLVSPSKTYAGSTGGSNCTSNGTITCVILVVKLSASSGSVPSSDITVKATRKVQPTGWADNSFTLDKKSDTLFSSTKGVYGVKPSYWAAQTSCANPTGIAASGATNTDVATYNIAVTQGGKTIGTTTGVNLCSGTSLSNAFEATKTVSVTVTPSGQAATKGGIKGTATWQDPLTNDTGACSAASFVDINGGPDKLSGGKQVQVEIGAGGAFSTNSNQLTPGGDYSVSVTCYDKSDPNESNVYGAVKTNVTVKAGQFVTVAFDKIQPTNAGGSTTPPNPKSSDDNDPLDCGAGDWNWLVCSGVQLLQKSATTMNNLINHYLIVDTNEVFSGTAGQDAYHQAWNSFRILATAILVIAGLIMVASEALGLELLDAYTIRKTLPRLLVGAIAISLSWPLMDFVIGFFNAFGKDIMNLIAVPFNTLENNQSATIITMANPLTVLMVAGGALWIFGPAALTFVLTAFLAILVAIIVLVIRQAAIIVLVVLAPVAIACYILPNTQKIWKLWYDNFLGLMMMYPIVMAFIAGGRVMAAAAGSHQDDPFYGVLSLIAYFIPYFLLPLAFRMATGAIGTIAGMVNDRHKGAFDRLKNMRSGAAATRHRMRMNEQMSQKGLGNTYRRAVHGLTVPNSGAFSLTRSGRARYDQYQKGVRAHIRDESLKNDNGRAAGDDIANEVAQMHDTTARNFVDRYARMAQQRGQAATQADGERQAREAMGLLETSYGAHMGTRAMQTAAFAAQQMSVTGYGDTDAEVQRRFQDAHNAVASGLMNATDAMAIIKQNKSRVEASSVSFGTGMNQIASGDIDVNALMKTALEGLTPGSLVGARRESSVIIARHLHRQLDQAVAAAGGNVNDPRVKRIGGQIAGIQDTINAQAPQMAHSFADNLLAQTISGTNLRVRDFTDQLRAAQDPDFNDVRKEWLAAGLPPGGVMPGVNPQPGGPPIAGPGGSGNPSDLRLKRDIVSLKKVNGIQLYRFRYIWSDQEYVGVIAQEVLKIIPEAVFTDPSGFYRVDYTALGLRMMTYEEWAQEHSTLSR